MKTEIIDENTAVLFTEDPDSIVRAVGTLINNTITKCSVVVEEDIPILSCKKNSTTVNLAIIKVAKDDEDEDLIDFSEFTADDLFTPAAESPEDLFTPGGAGPEDITMDMFTPTTAPGEVSTPPIKKVEDPGSAGTAPTTPSAPGPAAKAVIKKTIKPFVAPGPMIPENRTEQQKTDMTQLSPEMATIMGMLRKPQKNAGQFVDSALTTIENTGLELWDNYTGHSLQEQLGEVGPGKSTVSLKSKEQKGKIKHKRFNDFKIMELPNFTTGGRETPWVITDTSGGKGKIPSFWHNGIEYPFNEKAAHDNLYAFETKEEAEDYFKKMSTPGTAESSRHLSDINQFRNEIQNQLDTALASKEVKEEHKSAYLKDLAYLIWAQDKLIKLHSYITYPGRTMYSTVFEDFVHADTIAWINQMKQYGDLDIPKIKELLAVAPENETAIAKEIQDLKDKATTATTPEEAAAYAAAAANAENKTVDIPSKAVRTALKSDEEIARAYEASLSNDGTQHTYSGTNTDAIQFAKDLFTVGNDPAMQNLGRLSKANMNDVIKYFNGIDEIMRSSPSVHEVVQAPHDEEMTQYTTYKKKKFEEEKATPLPAKGEIIAPGMPAEEMFNPKKYDVEKKRTV